MRQVTLALLLLAGCTTASRPAPHSCPICVTPMRGSDACMKDGGCSQCAPAKSEPATHASCEHCERPVRSEEPSKSNVCAECSKDRSPGTHGSRCPTCGTERKHDVCPTCGACRECGRR